MPVNVWAEPGLGGFHRLVPVLLLVVAHEADGCERASGGHASEHGDGLGIVELDEHRERAVQGTGEAVEVPDVAAVRNGGAQRLERASGVTGAGSQ